MSKLIALLFASALWGPMLGGAAAAQAPGGVCSERPANLSAPGPNGPDRQGRRVVCADIAALDLALVHNRFDSCDPFGMIFALRRDLAADDAVSRRVTAADCAADDGKPKPHDATHARGDMRLRDCTRPRPLMRRAVDGDLPVVRLTNFLGDAPPVHPATFCRSGEPRPGSRAMHARAAAPFGAVDAAVAQPQAPGGETPDIATATGAVPSVGHLVFADAPGAPVAVRLPAIAERVALDPLAPRAIFRSPSDARRRRMSRPRAAVPVATAPRSFRPTFTSGQHHEDAPKSRPRVRAAGRGRAVDAGEIRRGVVRPHAECDAS